MQKRIEQVFLADHFHGFPQFSLSHSVSNPSGLSSSVTARGARIQALEEENKALRAENNDLRRQLQARFSPCASGNQGFGWLWFYACYTLLPSWLLSLLLCYDYANYAIIISAFIVLVFVCLFCWGHPTLTNIVIGIGAQWISRCWTPNWFLTTVPFRQKLVIFGVSPRTLGGKSLFLLVTTFFGTLFLWLSHPILGYAHIVMVMDQTSSRIPTSREPVAWPIPASNDNPAIWRWFAHVRLDLISLFGFFQYLVVHPRASGCPELHQSYWPQPGLTMKLGTAESSRFEGDWELGHRLRMGLRATPICFGFCWWYWMVIT